MLRPLEVLDPRWCDPAPPDELAAATEGRTVEAVARRGKYLTLELERRGPPGHAPAHDRQPAAGQAGRGRPGPAPPARALRARRRAALLFVDQRRFGTGVVLLGDDARDEYFASRLGVEPLSPDFTADALRALAKGRRAPVKAFLLTQERIAGVGNIYADEALYRARIHPLRPVGTLQPPADRRAARRGGGVAGGRDRRPRRDDRRLPPRRRRPRLVPGPLPWSTCARASPATRCGTTILKLRAAGRGTYVCPRCQRRRPRADGAPRARRPAGRSQASPSRSASSSSRKPPIERSADQRSGGRSSGR